MSIKNKQKFFIVMLVLMEMFANLSLAFAKEEEVHDATPIIDKTSEITINDIDSAGYQVIKKEEPQDNRFQGPDNYFRVAIDESKRVSESSDILMTELLFITSGVFFSGSKPVIACHGDTSFSLEADFCASYDAGNGKYQVYIYRAPYFIHMIGPNRGKLELLAEKILDKYKNIKYTIVK